MRYKTFKLAAIGQYAHYFGRVARYGFSSLLDTDRWLSEMEYG